MGLSMRVLGVQIRVSPASLPFSVSSGENMVFQAVFEKRDSYVTLSYWTHSFSGSPAKPYGLFS